MLLPNETLAAGGAKREIGRRGDRHSRIPQASATNMARKIMFLEIAAHVPNPWTCCTHPAVAPHSCSLDQGECTTSPDGWQRRQTVKPRATSEPPWRIDCETHPQVANTSSRGTLPLSTVEPPHQVESVAEPP
ncbi:hypothetical protein K443DRAFT_548233 [Laccaria amethystina LaAM-08-1]|uniref:Uncharacterized protein n=1 Tax=Laccaria amethystina LaAM-08-1 TaxID=1095629 RepID=A0A0C9WSI9_9AGAR|nr:hypothetical protein K443DRAFT_548233 [Laccaria amethystina LaAM-08-1]